MTNVWVVEEFGYRAGPFDEFGYQTGVVTEFGYEVTQFIYPTLLRNMIAIDIGGPNQTVIEVRPFNWPISRWEVMELAADMETGWNNLDDAAVARLRAIYNGAWGMVESGLRGLMVQYVPGTGGKPVFCRDWRGNIGYFAFYPRDGCRLDKIHGTDRYTGRLRLVQTG